MKRRASPAYRPAPAAAEDAPGNPNGASAEPGASEAARVAAIGR